MFRRSLLIALVLCSFGLISCSMQKLVEKEGWIPLRTFDFIQIAQNQRAEPASSAAPDAQKPSKQAIDEKKDSGPKEFTFLGAIVPFDPLDEYGLLWNKTHVISNMAGPIPIQYKYKVLYAKGPDTILNEQNYKIKLTDVNINSWLKFGIVGGAKSDLVLKNIIRAYIEIKDEDFLEVLESSDTMEKSERDFWITEILAADITNTEAAGLTFNAKVPSERFKVDIEAGIGDANKETITIQGPGLMFGARGYVITAKDKGNLESFAIPDHKTPPRTITLPVGQNKQLLITRTAEDSVDFSIIGASAGRVYVKNDKGEWKLDNETQAVASIKLRTSEATETALAKTDKLHVDEEVDIAMRARIAIATEDRDKAKAAEEEYRNILAMAAEKERNKLAAIKLPAEAWWQHVKIVERLPRRSNVIVLTIIKSETKFNVYGHVYSVQLDAANTVEKYLEVLRRKK